MKTLKLGTAMRTIKTASTPLTPIMSIDEIAGMLHAQAELRAPENDEGGILLDLADRLIREVAALEEPS